MRADLELRVAPVIAAALLVCCAGVSSPPLLGRAIPTDHERPSSQRADDRRAQVLRFAQGLLDGAPLHARGVDFPADPVGFVRACYWQAGIDLYDPAVATSDAMQALYRSAANRNWLHAESPRPGDLVFFDANDRGSALYPAQVAIVVTLGGDGTLTVIGSFVNGPERINLNLRDPERTTAEDGRRINDLLAGDATLTAAQLFRSFADPFRER